MVLEEVVMEEVVRDDVMEEMKVMLKEIQARM